MSNFKIYSRAVILNEDRDKVLLIKKNSKQKIASNNWMLPGGTLEFNEEIELSLMREVKEETNLDIVDLQLINSKKMLINGTHWLGLYYLVNVFNENNLLNIEKNKHEKVKFIYLKDIPHLKDYSVLQFIKGIDSNREFFDAKAISENEHVMKESLPKYVVPKIHSLLKENIDSFSRVKIIGNYDRSFHVSIEEKNDKLFNLKRPTAFIDESILYISCFPGMDYIYHYAKLVSTYLKIKNYTQKVSYVKPSLQAINNSFKQSNLISVPSADIIIFGNIDKIGIFEGMEFSGDGDFLWKKGKINGKEVLLLGCKFSIWGSSAYDMLKFMAKNIKFSTFIYIGKLGSLSKDVKSNKYIATGEESLVGDKVIRWDNIFTNIDDKNLIHGKHVTCPSILDETKKQINIYKDIGDVIDPEIGNMALACQEFNKSFSYLHIISDNVVNHDKEENLSNEREVSILDKRKGLFKQIGAIIEKKI